MPNDGLFGSLKHAIKRGAYRAMRPGLSDVSRQLDRIERRLQDEPRESGKAKYESELDYWKGFVRGGAKKQSGLDFEQLFGNWTRTRIIALGTFLGLDAPKDKEQPGPIDDWCAERTAIELGSGPYPTLASARKGWLKAIAVDPLARRYVEENLVPKVAERIVFVASKGETIPLPTESADLVVCENCLDHVSEPVAVVDEIRRLLKPGGYLWFFVDLSDHRDHMHPHAMNEKRVKALLEDFEEVRAAVTDHKAHPKAYGSLRGLYRKPVRVHAGGPDGGMPEVVVTNNVHRDAEVALG